MAWVREAVAIPSASAVTAVAAIAIGSAFLFDCRCVEEIDLVAHSTDACMAQQAIVLESYPTFMPRAGQPHIFVRELPVAAQAHIGVNHFTHGQVGWAVSGCARNLIAWVITLMASGTAHIGDFLDERRGQMTLVESHLVAFVSIECLIPSECIGCFQTRR